MVMSALSAPIYARSLIDAVLRRKSKFVVTPKGDSASPDSLSAPSVHLFWVLSSAARSSPASSWHSPPAVDHLGWALSPC